jgi:hypothetical protein
MRRWFLSYHSPDEALTERLKAGIERKDDGAIVFFAPSNLRSGARWAPALAEAIAEATAFVPFATERGIGRWQEIEYEHGARQARQFTRFPDRAHAAGRSGGPALGFPEATPLDAADRGCGLRPRCQAWRALALHHALSAMEEKDSDYFFGRERETEVLNVLAAQSGGLPVVLGNSGVGKSSLAQAGVIAALRRQAWLETVGDVGPWPPVFQNSRRWCFLGMRPGAE